MMTNLFDNLPKVRGSYQDKFPLNKITWFKVGGKASILFKPIDVDDLAYFLQHKNPKLPYFILGAGSNLIVRDGGFKGVVIKLGKGFNSFCIVGDNLENITLEVGAACLDQVIAQKAVSCGLSGLEFLSGIPGVIGGAIAMNAGCYEKEIKDVLLWAEGLDKKGQLHRLSNKELKFSYRKCGKREKLIFVKACFQVTKGKIAEIQHTVSQLLEKRNETQPTKGATSGCTFANPTQIDKKAWQLIREAGCLEDNINGAHFSKLHSNFMIGGLDVKASDLEALGMLARKKVFDKFGVELQWEIMVIGETQGITQGKTHT